MFLGCALAGTASLAMAIRNHHQMNVMQSHLRSSVQDRLTLSPPTQSPRSILWQGLIHDLPIIMVSISSLDISKRMNMLALFELLIKRPTTPHLHM